MEPQKNAAFIAAERQLRDIATVPAPDPADDAFAMQARPSTIETWLGDNHAAGD